MNWRARGGAGHCVGAFDIDILTLITHTKSYFPLKSLYAEAAHSFSTSFPFGCCCCFISMAHCVAFSYIPAESGVTNEIRIGRFPLPHWGPPFCHFSQNRRGNFLNQMVYTVQWTRRKRDPLLPRLPLLLHTSWSTHKLWNPKGKIQAKKANALFNNRKEERKRERKRRGFPIDFRMEQPKYAGRKKNSKHLLWK